VRLRDALGKKVESPARIIGKTDDRGIYRFYGLRPGAYLIRAEEWGFDDFNVSPYLNMAPSYYPSNSRATAKEIVVSGGDEVSGIDISLRRERGHVVMGTVVGASLLESKIVSVQLSPASSGMVDASTNAQDDGGAESFAFAGVDDGVYELVAFNFDMGDGSTVFSRSQQITVKGKDVTGIKLSILPTGAVVGRVTIEEDSTEKRVVDCEKAKRLSLDDIVVNAVPVDSLSALELLHSSNSYVAIDPSGTFNLQALAPGAYRLDTWLPSEELFVRSMADSSSNPPVSAPAPKSVPATVDKLTIGPGQTVKGLLITLARGAASLSGMVNGDRGLPDDLRIFLVPLESDATDQSWRYYETTLDSSGKFTMGHIAPGKYKMIASPPTRDGDRTMTIGRFASDKSRRAVLRKEAEISGKQIELKPCQRMQDVVVSYNADK